MNRRFYNYICTVYTLGTVVTRGTSVQDKILKYTNIPCALWKNTKSYGESQLAVQTDSNKYEMNFLPQYSISIGDIISANVGELKVDQVIEHHNSKGKLDNLQVFVSKTT